MTRSRRILLSMAGAALLLALAGAALLYWAIESGWLRDRLREQVIATATRLTGSRVELASFDVNWGEPAVELGGLVLYGASRGDEPPLLSIHSARAGLAINWDNLRFNPLLLESVEVRRLQLYLRVSEDGQLNLPQPAGAAEGVTVLNDLLRLAIGRLAVEEGLLIYNDRRIPFRAESGNVRLGLDYDPWTPGYRGELSVEKLAVDAPGFPLLESDLSAALDLRHDRLELTQGRLRESRFEGSWSASLVNFADPSLAFELDGATAVAHWVREYRLPILPEGRIRVSGGGSWAADQPWRIRGTARAEGLGYRDQTLAVTGIEIGSSATLDSSGLTLSDLRARALGATFTGEARLEAFRQVAVRGMLDGLSLGRAAAALGQETYGWDAWAGGPVELTATLRDNELPEPALEAAFRVTPASEQRPLRGSVQVSYTESRGWRFGDSELRTPASEISFGGQPAAGLRFTFATTDAHELISSYEPLLARTAEWHLETHGLAADLQGRVTGSWEDPVLDGHLSVANIRIRDGALDRLFGDVTLRRTGFRTPGLMAEQGPLRARAQGGVQLEDWEVLPESRIDGLITVSDARLERILTELRLDPVVSGRLAGEVSLGGSVGEPQAVARFQIDEGAYDDQPFDRARAALHLEGDTVELVSLTAATAGGQLEAKGEYRFERPDWLRGRVSLTAAARGVDLARVRLLEHARPGLAGSGQLEVNAEARVAGRELHLLSLTGTGRVSELRYGTAELGALELKARTQGSLLSVAAQGRLAEAPVTGEAEWRLEGDYPVKGSARFSQLTVAALENLFRDAPTPRAVPLDSRIDGQAEFTGRGIDFASWTTRLELATILLEPRLAGRDDEAARVLSVRNDAPVVIAIEGDKMRIDQLRLVGSDTDLEVRGGGALGEQGPLDLRINGAINLGLLENLEPDLRAGGQSTVNATVRGSIRRPLIAGRLTIADGSFYLSGLPNGLDQANGLILFDGERATVENLTAETGGGKLTMSGFVGFGREELVYRLTARASSVRVRYPPGVSTTVDADLVYSGTPRNSLLSGEVEVQRAVINPRLDLARALTEAGTPMVTPATSNELLRGMRLDVRLRTAPNARFETSLTRDIHAEIDQRLRGSPSNPVLLGQVAITQGEINFFGGRYIITRGEISFINPVRIEPVLNLDLQTRVRSVEVNLTVTGPIDRMNVNYRSDPPLQLSEILALLATGRAPVSDPAFLARQEVLSQSYGQIGASSLIGQALTSPISSRLQRFFGVSRIRINPQLAGLDTEPQARVTFEQQVSQKIVLIFTTNLTRGQEQAARLEWDVSPEWLVMGGREENGLFAVDFLFRKRF